MEDARHFCLRAANKSSNPAYGRLKCKIPRNKQLLPYSNWKLEKLQVTTIEPSSVQGTNITAVGGGVDGRAREALRLAGR
jgi:hypothetical protein